MHGNPVASPCVHNTLHKMWSGMNTPTKGQHGSQIYSARYVVFNFLKNKQTLALVCTRQDGSTDLLSAAPAGAALGV